MPEVITFAITFGRLLFHLMLLLMDSYYFLWRVISPGGLLFHLLIPSLSLLICHSCFLCCFCSNRKVGICWWFLLEIWCSLSNLLKKYIPFKNHIFPLDFKVKQLWLSKLSFYNHWHFPTFIPFPYFEFSDTIFSGFFLPTYFL